MPIAREGQFLLTHDLATRGPGKDTTLVLESAQLEACIEEVQLRGYTGVAGNPEFGFQERTLDALGTLAHLRRVWFWDIHLTSIDALYDLKQLEVFGVHERRPPIAFERLPGLRKVTWMYRPKDTGIETLSLDLLALWRFNPKARSFEGLQLPATLTELHISWCNPETLQGLTPCPSLKRLEIACCRNLSSLEAVPRLFPNLEYLVVTACGRMRPEEGDRIRASLPSLDHAYVQSRVIA